MDNLNIIDFFFNIFNVIIAGARSVYNVLSYQIPLGGFFRFLGGFFDFFGADIDLSQYYNTSVSVMTIAGALLGVIIIVIIIKKIIPLL